MQQKLVITRYKNIISYCKFLKEIEMSFGSIMARKIWIETEVQVTKKTTVS